MEEEKRQRQAEMKQKREERLRKALQARERAEEEKKKRMEQKILQSDEKVRLSQVRDREEKAEERGRKKLSKKSGEAEARRQKALKGEEDEREQPELLQKRREDEVKGKGKKVLELKNLLEQQHGEHGKERDHRHGGKEKLPHPQLGAAAHLEKHRKQEEAALQRPGERKLRQPEAAAAAAGTGQRKVLKKSISAPYLKPLKGTGQSSHPKVSEDNYGMDQNSDDATDDENDPRKPVPAWADGPRLKQDIMHQYYHPVNTDQLFGLISGLRLDEIFGKSKPRYFKRTSSAVWHSPPRPRSASGPSCSLNR
ncbi:inner centromere protein A-like isoform X1 [Melopsittacus undulatus]|uniref:inner centromere protein A-like isoform X1 n=1 Tax=Melopsittacus undulatus TaxID=13146 RepID=UPI00146EC400|nr:inner centromere protein A-like isoform X1 [Melopsittacus undulatus]XP_033917445.1 inner centromere protein A-like isoform X1 [Melopsittacus undulatus]